MNRFVTKLTRHSNLYKKSLFHSLNKNRRGSTQLRTLITRNFSKNFNHQNSVFYNLNQLRRVNSFSRSQSTARIPKEEDINNTNSQEERPNEQTDEQTDQQENHRPNEEDEEEYYEEDEDESPEPKSFINTSLLKSAVFLGLVYGLYYYYDTVVFDDMDTPLYRHLFEKYFSFIYKPNLKEFLPMDPPLHPQVKPKTLIISFEDMLYHKNYEAGSGIVIDLRPGLRDFLKDLSRKFEIILFSDEDSQFMEEVVSTVDPYQMHFKYAFGREFFAMHRGRYMKDYDYFNRDFRNVVIVDFNDKQNYNRRENLVLLGKYQGENSDTSLNELKSFLLHCHKFEDVRKVIQNFGGTGCVENFVKQKSEYNAKIKKKKGFFASLFGKK